MNDFWLSTGEWWVRSMTFGSLLLLLGYIGLRVTRNHALAYQQAKWAVRAAVLVPLLCLLPSWISLPSPTWVETATANVEPLPVQKAEVASASTSEGATESAPQEWGWVLVSPPDEEATPFADEIASKTQTSSEAVSAPSTAPPQANAIETRTESVAASSWHEAIGPILLSAYCIVVFGFLVHLTLGYLALSRLCFSAREAPESLRTRFAEFAQGMWPTPRLVVSDRIESPICFGLIRPTVVIPVQLATSAGDDELRWVFAHETDHLRRGDHRLLWWLGFARAVFFFVPWFWGLQRRIELVREYLADAAAAEVSGRAADYAAFLVDLSGKPVERRLAQAPVLAMGGRPGRSDLFRRITMLLQSNGAVRRRIPRGWRMVVAGGAISAAVLLSGIGWVAADEEKPKPERVEKDAPRDGDAPKAPREGDQPRRDGDPKPRGDREAPKPARDGDAPKAPREGDQPRRDGDAPKAPREGDRPREGARDGDRPKVGPRDGDRPALFDVDQYFRRIEEAARKNDPAELKKVMEEMQRDMARRFPREGMNFPRDFNPLFVPLGREARREASEVEKLRRAMDDTIKEFDESIAKAPDEAAKENLRRSRDEYRKATEESIKKAEQQARNRLLVEPRDGDRRRPEGLAPLFPGIEGFQSFRGFDLGGGGNPRFGVLTGPVPEALAEQFYLPADKGLLVVSVVRGSVAEKAGVKKNDVLLSFAGKELSGNPAELSELVTKADPNAKVDVVVLRKGKKEEIKGVELPKVDARAARVGAIPRFQFGGPESDFESMEVIVKNDGFTIRASKAERSYEMKGAIQDGKSNPTSIEITDGEKKIRVEALEKVPEEYRRDVTELLRGVGGR